MSLSSSWIGRNPAKVKTEVQLLLDSPCPTVRNGPTLRTSGTKRFDSSVWHQALNLQVERSQRLGRDITRDLRGPWSRFNFVGVDQRLDHLRDKEKTVGSSPTTHTGARPYSLQAVRSHEPKTGATNSALEG